MTPQQRRENYRQTRKEARVALLGWIFTLVWVVGVSWWLGAERPTAMWAGVPQWVVLGVGIGWLCAFAFNSWYSARMLSNDGSSASASPERQEPR